MAVRSSSILTSDHAHVLTHTMDQSSDPSNSNIIFSFAEIEKVEIELVPIVQWLNQVASLEKKQIEQLHYIVCSDEFLLDLNQRFLNHDSFTDILTFPESYDPIIAEIFISLPRVQENAILHSQGNLEQEFYRVLLHGLLHMCAYDDHSESDIVVMQNKENHYLQKMLP